MHIFLLDIPNVEFAAFIPKGDYVTFCMLGNNINTSVLDKFMNTPEVKMTIPANMYQEQLECRCNPKINIRSAVKPFADRIVFIGDCGVTRLYKDGIGAGYSTAKTAASTAIFKGISEKDFRKYFWPACKKINQDNLIGKVIFSITKVNQKVGVARTAMLEMVRLEQINKESFRYMSTVLWDMFTGSATYREIFLLTLHPVFLFRFIKFITKIMIQGKFGKVEKIEAR